MWKRANLPAFLLGLAISAGHPQDRYFDSGGVQIRFTVEGQGEALVLLHGFATSLDMMAALTPALSEEYRVVAMDARGHGKSGKPHDPKAYGTEMALDVVRLLDHLAIERAHLVGYSMGGAVALKLLAEHPERVISAVIGGYGWRKVPEEAGQDLMERVADSLERGEGFGPLFEAIAPDGPARDPRAVEEATRRVLLLNDVRALAAAARGFRQMVPGEQELRANQVPALALIGERDGFRPDVERLESAMGGLRVEVVEGADHMSAFTDPAFLAGVRSFLAAHPARGELEPLGR